MSDSLEERKTIGDCWVQTRVICSESDCSIFRTVTHVVHVPPGDALPSAPTDVAVRARLDQLLRRRRRRQGRRQEGLQPEGEPPTAAAGSTGKALRALLAYVGPANYYDLVENLFANSVHIKPALPQAAVLSLYF